MVLWHIEAWPTTHAVYVHIVYGHICSDVFELLSFCLSLQIVAPVSQPSRAVASAPAAKQLTVSAPKPVQTPRNSSKPAASGSEPRPSETQKPGQPQAAASKTQASAKEAHTTLPSALGQGQAKQVKPTATVLQAPAPAGKPVAFAKQSAVTKAVPAAKPSGLPESQPSAVTSVQSQAAKVAQPAKVLLPAGSKDQHSQNFHSMSKATASAGKVAQAKSPRGLVKSTPEVQTKASQAAATAVHVVDDWADKGVPVQSGYHMSDSPLPEDEDSSPPTATGKAVYEALHAHVAAAKIVPSRDSSSAKVAAQQQKANAAKPDLLKSPALAASSSKASPRSSDKKAADKAAVNAADKAGLKQTCTLQSATAAVSAEKAAASSKTAQGIAILPVTELLPRNPLLASSKVIQSAQATARPSRLSVSSSTVAGKPAAMPPPAPLDLPRKGSDKQAPALQDDKLDPSTIRKEIRYSSSPAAALADRVMDGALESTVADRDKPSKAAVVNKTASLSKPMQTQHGTANGAAPTASTASVEAKAAPLNQTKPAKATTVKPAAPRQSSAALSAIISTLWAADGGKKLSKNALAAQNSATPVAEPELRSAAVMSSTDASVARAAFKPAKPSQAVPGQPPLPESTPPPSSQRAGPFIGEQQTLAAPPIPGLASPEAPAGQLPSRPAAKSTDTPSAHKPGKVALSTPQPPLPPLPSSTAPPAFQLAPDSYPPEPSSPRPSPAVSSKKRIIDGPLLQQASAAPSDSGEDMDIDQEPGQEPLPPLPTEPFPPGLELAMLDSSQEVMAISAEDRHSLLDELSGIKVSFPPQWACLVPVASTLTGFSSFMLTYGAH